jgi:subtilisin family serine protease
MLRPIAALAAAVGLLGGGLGQHQFWPGDLCSYEFTGTARFRAVAEGLLASAAGSDSLAAQYYVIQLDTTPSDRVCEALEQAGATLHDYVAHNAYLARVGRSAVASVRRVAGVRDVYPYDPILRVGPDLARRLSAPTAANPIYAGSSITLGVELFSDAAVTPIEEYLRANGAVIQAVEAAGGGVMIFVEAPAYVVPALIMTEGVKWVDRAWRPLLFNSIARILVGADPAGLRYAPGQYLFGQGEVIALLDSGLDTGDVATMHPDLKDQLLDAEGWGVQGVWADGNGHGTHVAGTIVGNGAQSGSNPATRSYASSYAGMAPEAKLSFHSIMDDAGNLVGAYDFNLINAVAYADGARISSNSWGADTRGVYDYWARLADTFATSHPDVLVVFAAGNAGVDRDWNGVIDLYSIGSPASGKNVLAVGASENNETGRTSGTRLNLNYSAFGINSAPFGGDSVANHPSGIAAFSSRGPTRDGRVKPELVAPGTAIISTRSSDPLAYYSRPVGSDYAILSGTSMATPVVAGGAAVVRQYLRTVLGITDPPAALLKAVLMASTRDLAPGQYGSGLQREIPPTPNSVEGVGRLDVAAATGPALRILAEDDTVTRFDYREYTINVPGGKPEMRVVLAWTDPLGASTTNFQLVNNLDLMVYDPTGRRYFARSERDNFETLYWQNPTPGTWRFRVMGTRVNTGSQNYSMALFWRW